MEEVDNGYHDAHERFLERERNYYIDEEHWPDPCDAEKWRALIQDPQWKYTGRIYLPSPFSSEALSYGIVSKGKTSHGSIFSNTPRVKSDIYSYPVDGPDTRDMQKFCLAPKWIFEKEATKIPEEEERSLDTYMKRLICALSGRFVSMGNDFGGTVIKTKGIPQAGRIYRWRYWDNAGNVYDDNEITCTTYHNKYNATCDEMYVEGLDYWGSLPGDFRFGKQTWMCKPEYASSCMGCGMAEVFGGFGTISMLKQGGALMDEFWDYIWAWNFNGTTNCDSWDRRLVQLAESAGVPFSSMSSKWVFNEKDLYSVANAKGWIKVECKQPAMASYKKHDTRINFYLSTGTVGSSLDHPKKGKTQLFRRKVTEYSALFDNPRLHTGKGYYTKKGGGDNDTREMNKKRKRNDNMEQTLQCYSCKQYLDFEDFSKNQRKRSSRNRRCKACIGMNPKPHPFLGHTVRKR